MKYNIIACYVDNCWCSHENFDYEEAVKFRKQCEEIGKTSKNKEIYIGHYVVPNIVRDTYMGEYISETLWCEECGEQMDAHPKQYGCGAVCHGCALMLTLGMTQADLDWITEELNSNVLW